MNHTVWNKNKSTSDGLIINMQISQSYKNLLPFIFSF